MAENVRVVVRCRPMNQREHDLNCRNIVQIENCTVSVANPSDPTAPAKQFTFDSVYDGLSSTETLYNDVCYSLVDNVLEGYNGTIFAYGQTGCGKTHTMQGPDNLASGGIIRYSFEQLFEGISVASGVRYLALVNYLEIYNETIRDLLDLHEGVNANHVLKEQPGLGVTIPTLSTHTVHNASECCQLLSLGNRNRVVGATLMNATSSRSHSIFTISLEQMQDNDVDGVGDGGIRRGKLNLVDLAGSERQNKTGAVGERLKEATKINLSLSALGNVISALVDGKTKHIPYRDSKLTRLLQDSLGGNTKTLMISCISPADSNYDETISTLRYASRAKNIANKPQINEDPKDAKLREYQKEILKLRKLLDETYISTASRGGLVNEVNQAWLEPQATTQMIANAEEDQSKQQDENEKQVEDGQELPRHCQKQNVNNEPLAASGHSATSSQRRASHETLQLEARKRIEMIKQALIGGERADDTQLRERRRKKKMDAQRRLSALAHVLSRVEQSEDRDLLQGHYTNIQQELNAKNEYLKMYRQKNKALEREVADLQTEFQLDRADYLDSIRRLERNLKFYQQILDKALPILRKDGKYWDPDEILQNSSWNDDLKMWKLPESSMNSFKLPPATQASLRPQMLFENTLKPGSLAVAISNADTVPKTGNGDDSGPKENGSESPRSFSDSDVWKGDGLDDHTELSNKTDILQNYFRPQRRKHTDFSYQKKSLNNWKEFASRTKSSKLFSQDNSNELQDHDYSINILHKKPSDSWINIVPQTPMSIPALGAPTSTNQKARVPSSWLPQHHRSHHQIAELNDSNNNRISVNKSWDGVSVLGEDNVEDFGSKSSQQDLNHLTNTDNFRDPKSTQLRTIAQ